MSLVSVCLTAIAGLYWSQSSPAGSPSLATDMPVGTAAMRISLDPETGEWVTGSTANTEGDVAPTVDQKSVDLAHMLSRSTEGLTKVHHPDGRVSVHLEGRFMSASVARIGDDGKVETLCSEDLTEAKDFLNADKSETDANGLEVR